MNKFINDVSGVLMLAMSLAIIVPLLALLALFDIFLSIMQFFFIKE